ncbi:uncharacterized protein [Antedon mediterranea]|uniref:uncharacterized protein n=1 Tax=Antedon mediterranea TaxID=105859 RepID=UPI003AF5DD08
MFTEVSITTASSTTEAATTDASTTEASTTEASTTEAVTTEPLTTEASTTEAATTEAATTEAPKTEVSTTEISTTSAATTETSSTEASTTEASSTEASTTEAPTTEAPTTEASTIETFTTEVSTDASSTKSSTTEAPTTEAPTTEAPTTKLSSTEILTTAAATTEASTTDTSSTKAPTTEASTTKSTIKAATTEVSTTKAATTEVLTTLISTTLPADIDPPAVSCPNNVSTILNEGAGMTVVNYTAAASDNVGITSESFDIPSGSMFSFGETIVTFTAFDEAGNMGNCSFPVTVVDNEAPTVTCPSDITTNLTDGAKTAVINYTATATDNVDIASETFSVPAGSSFPVGETEVTFMAFDVAGNTKECTFTISVKDFEDPTITCPLFPVVETDSRSPEAIVVWVVQVEDNSGEVATSSSHSPGDSFPIGRTTVEYVATDSSGNVAECSFDINVEDKEIPNLVCPSNVVSDIDRSVTWEVPEPDDNSGEEVTLSASASPDDEWEVGTYSVTYTATDIYENTATCSFMVSVIDACTDIVCLNDGVCQADNGVFQCICQLFYSGEFCEIEPDPPVFTVLPNSVTANLYDSVEMICAVFNSDNWQWYKDGVSLVSTSNRESITVMVTIDNQGYYTCSGYGAGPHSATLFSSDGVPLLVQGISVIPVSMAFSKTFTENLNDPSSTAFKDESSNITTFLNKELMLDGGETFLQVRSFSEGSIISLVNFYVLLNANTSYSEFSEALTVELIRIGNNSDGYLLADMIVLSSTESCYEDVYDGLYAFPETQVDTIANSEETCDESKVNYLLPIATRACGGDGFSPAEWEDPAQTDCGPDATAEQLLDRIVMMNVTMENVEEVSNDVEEITSNTEEITVNALESTAEVLEEISQTGSNSTEVTDSMVTVVDNLFGVDEDILMESQVEDQAPTMIVEALEQQLSQVELDEDGTYMEITPNVAVQAQMINADQISQVNTTYLSYISKSNQDGVGNVEVITDDTQIPETANVSIALPTSISDVIKENNMTDFRVVVVVYNDSRLFQSSQFINESSGRRPNSQVISLSIPDLERVELEDPIVITFIPLEISETNINTTCVFWDFNLFGTGGWSSEGCTFVNGSTDGSDRQYCECTHLTNFAILMDFYNTDIVLPPAADIVTLVGLILSIVSLCLTIITFLTKRKFRRSEPKQILCHLCVSLLSLYVVFLAGIDQTGNRRGCIAAGALVHYFLLSSIFWMTVQAVNMYYLFVKVFDTHVSRFLVKASLFAWGLPVAIVLICVLIDIDGYVNGEAHCFLTLQRMYYGVAIPVALCLLFNMIIFVMVLHSLSKMGKNSNQARPKGTKRRGIKMLQNGASIVMVLGLTWLVGFFAIGEASVFVLWLFCILNSFQGFLIFVMYCARSSEVRSHWWKMLRAVPKHTKMFRSIKSGSTAQSTFYSKSYNNPNSKSYSSSYPSESRIKRSEKSEVVLGKNSLSSNDVILMRR